MSDPKQIVNLGMLAQQIAQDADLPGRTRTEWVSGVATFARACNRDPSEIVASPKHLRHLMQGASWQLAGLSPGTWANVKSRLRAMLQHAGIDIDRQRQFSLAPAWQKLLSLLVQSRRADLSGFAGFCTAHEIGPQDVRQEVFAWYLTYCTELMMRSDPRGHWRSARRAWNKVVSLVPEQALATIEMIGTSQWRGPSWSTFPETLRREVEVLNAWLLEGDFDGMGEDSDVREPLAPATVKVYWYDLRAHASHLTESGIPIDELSSLTSLVNTDNVKRSFQHQLRKEGLTQPKGKICFRLFGQMAAILAAARFLQVPEEQMLLLKKRMKWVRPAKTGMSSTKKARLHQFSDPEVEGKFLNLPSAVAAELSNIDKPTALDALEMQTTAAFELHINWPVRIGNVADLDLEKHIRRPPGGVQGCWLFEIEGDEVKNDMPLSRQLNEDSSALPELYVRKFRPILLRDRNCSRLFITQHGRPKSRSELAQQMKRFLKRRLGLQWNSHLMRSLSGQILLDEHPGHYVDVQRMLEHSNIQTTLAAYVGTETRASFRQYDETLERRRGKSSIDFPAEPRHPADSRKTKRGGKA